MKKNKMYKQNKGSAMITVLVVVTVLMTIVLSVLQISYRYYISENGTLYTQKCKEAAQSFSEELKNEITASFETFDQQNANASGIWKYIRYNLCTERWKYEAKEAPVQINSSDSEYYKNYNVSDMLKQPTDADSLVKKEFELTLDESKINGDADTVSLVKEEMPVIHLTLTWQPGDYKNCLNGSRLYAETVCTMGDYSYRITNVYKFNGGRYACDDDKIYEEVADGEGNRIFKNHKWIWTYDYKY